MQFFAREKSHKLLKSLNWCPWPDSNQHSLRNLILSQARLPIPPQGQSLAHNPICIPVPDHALAGIIAAQSKASTRAKKRQRPLAFAAGYGAYRAIPAGLCSGPTIPPCTETAMNEEALNMSLRKFLKVVGVTSQQEIEKAIRAAVAEGRIKGDEALEAQMVLTIGKVGLNHKVNGTIDLK